MSQGDLLENLKKSYNAVSSGRRNMEAVSVVRRCLIAAADILEVYLNFKRDRKWDRYY